MKADCSVVFLGTPDFAVPSLEALHKNGYDIRAVISQPDRPKGRGHKVVPTPTKIYAIEYGLPIHQFEKISSPKGVALLKELAPDVMVTAAFGQILSEEVLAIPKYGCVNVHASLLPKYRGAAPIQWAVMNGEKKTGVTTMFTVKALDAGDILLKEEMEIPHDMTAGELYDKLRYLGADTLLETLRRLKEGTLTATPQNEAEATYYPMFKKGFGAIDFNKPCEQIYNFVRGLSPFPGAYVLYDKEKIKIFRVSADYGDFDSGVKNGTVVCSNSKNGLGIKAADGTIWIEELQRQGARRMGARESLRGRAIALGHEFRLPEGV